jgi:hypothetical protein
MDHLLNAPQFGEHISSLVAILIGGGAILLGLSGQDDDDKIWQEALVVGFGTLVGGSGFGHFVNLFF